MLYNKIFDRNKTLAFNARTVGNLQHNHPVELSNQEDKAIHLIHTNWALLAKLLTFVDDFVRNVFNFGNERSQLCRKEFASCNILVRTLLLIYIYTNEYKAATDLTVSNLLNLLFSFIFWSQIFVTFLCFCYRCQIDLGTEHFSFLIMTTFWNKNTRITSVLHWRINHLKLKHSHTHNW